MKPKKLPTKAAVKKSPAKAKENKPIAKKPAKKREGESSIRIAKKAPNPQQVRKTTKHPALAAPYGKAAAHAANYSAPVFEEIRHDVAFIRQNLVAVGMSAIRKTLVEAMPTKRRDPLGEDTSFDAAVFGDRLSLLSHASRAEVFFPRDYAAALKECQNAGFDIEAMLITENVRLWKTADIERLISYLTTLCHIKRAVRSGSETIDLASARAEEMEPK